MAALVEIKFQVILPERIHQEFWKGNDWKGINLQAVATRLYR
jgi:hypothetical protein